MMVLRGVVYRLKRMGPRTDPCGTPQVVVDEEEILGWMATTEVRDDR